MITHNLEWGAMEGHNLTYISLIFVLLQGCVSVDKTDGKEIRIGIIADKAEFHDKAVRKVRTTFGGWFSKSGTGLGFKQEQWIKIDSDCQIIFIVDTKSETEVAVDLIKSTFNTGGEKICAVKE